MRQLTSRPRKKPTRPLAEGNSIHTTQKKDLDLLSSPSNCPRSLTTTSSQANSPQTPPAQETPHTYPNHAPDPNPPRRPHRPHSREARRHDTANRRGRPSTNTHSPSLSPRNANSNGCLILLVLEPARTAARRPPDPNDSRVPRNARRLVAPGAAAGLHGAPHNDSDGRAAAAVHAGAAVGRAPGGPLDGHGHDAQQAWADDAEFRARRVAVPERRCVRCCACGRADG
jgi:hypothetical protein